MAYNYLNDDMEKLIAHIVNRHRLHRELKIRWKVVTFRRLTLKEQIEYEEAIKQRRRDSVNRRKARTNLDNNVAFTTRVETNPERRKKKEKKRIVEIDSCEFATYEEYRRETQKIYQKRRQEKIRNDPELLRRRKEYQRQYHKNRVLTEEEKQKKKEYRKNYYQRDYVKEKQKIYQREYKKKKKKERDLKESEDNNSLTSRPFLEKREQKQAESASAYASDAPVHN